MTKSTELINVSRYGAGNEYLVNQLRHNIDSADIVLCQWAQPHRLDLVLDHKDPTFWQKIITSDTTYSNNVVHCGDDQIWLSSASTAEPIQKYHDQYITIRQHQMRSQIYIEYAKLLLEHRNQPYGFMLANDSDYINVDANWIWHEDRKGLSSFKTQSQYQDLDLGLIQPIPLIAFEFVKKFIVPKIELNWRTDREINTVENMLYRHYQESVKNRPNDTN